MGDEDKTVSSITIRYTDGTVASLVGEEADDWKRYVNHCMTAARQYAVATEPAPDVDWEITEEGKL